MSKIGKLTRGLKFSLHRKGDGNLPNGITDNPSKMNDLNFYLEYVKNRNKKEVDNALSRLRNLSREGFKRKQVYRNTYNKLMNIKETKPKPQTKSKGKK